MSLLKIYALCLLVWSQWGYNNQSSFQPIAYSPTAFHFSADKNLELNIKKTAEHDFHLSNCDIDFNEKSQSLQIIMKLFIDDMETVIKESGVDDKLQLFTNSEHEQADEHIANYLASHFTIGVDGEETSFVFIGKEISDDILMMSCYLEIEDISAVEELLLKHDVMTEVFADQVNLVSIKKNGKNLGHLMLKKGASEELIKF